MSFTDLPPGAKVVTQPPPPRTSPALQAAKGVQQAQPGPLMQAQDAAAAMAEHGNEMPGIVPGAPDPGRDPGSGWQQAMDVVSRLIQTAPWAVGMRGTTATQPAPEPPAQGPWGPSPAPSNPAPSMVPSTGGPTPGGLVAADRAAQQGAYEDALTKAVGTAANRSVAGFNMNAAKTNPANVAARAGQQAVEGALKDVNQPPPAPPEPFVPSAPGPKPPSQVTPDELRAFLKENGVAPADIEAAVKDHTDFISTSPKPGAEAAPEPAQPVAKAAPKPARGGAPARTKPTPGPPEPEQVYSDRKIDVPSDPGARQWLRKAAGILRSAHSIQAILKGNPGPMARQAMTWVIRNYPEVEARNPQTLNKIADDLLSRLK